MKRMLVICASGSGKSTFSKRLGEMTGLDVIHLDKAHWLPGWVEPRKDEWRQTVEMLLQGDSWIIDGNYSGTLELRLSACDTVIFLDLSRLICTWRVFKRVLQHNGRSRPDMPPGCEERLDLKFLIWTWKYPARSRPRVISR